MKKRYGRPEVQRLIDNPAEAPTGGESFNDFKARFMPWFDKTDCRRGLCCSSVRDRTCGYLAPDCSAMPTLWIWMKADSPACTARETRGTAA